jgi:Fur family zinc uptake transcriptional regulator
MTRNMRTDGLSVNDATVSGLVQAASQPLSAYEIVDKMRPERPRIAPTAVYHALHRLAADGLVHRIETLNAWFAPRASTPREGGIVRSATITSLTPMAWPSSPPKA